MATIPTTSGAVYMNTPRRSYMATRVFDDDFYSYTTSINPTTFARVGTLAPVTTDVTKCPQGRILRENGRKLYPGAYPGVTEYMVGVYDAQTGLSGFINPNSAVFLVLNGDKPEYLPQGSETDDGTFTGLNQGQPVFTHGDINAGGAIDISGDGVIHGDMNVGEDLDVAGYVASGSYVLATGNIQTTGGSIILSENTGTGLFRLPTTLVGISNMASGSISGGFRKLTVSAAGCRTTSKVFLTYAGQNNAGVLSAEAITNGSFQIVSSNTADAGTVQWLIINAA
jgi:hypothetical protein